MSTAARPSGRRYTVVAVLAAIAICVGAVGPWAYGSFADTTAKDRIAAAPPPALFPDADVAPLGRRIAAQGGHAHTIMTRWWDRHGTRPDDAAFARWLEQHLPGPPSPAQRATEIAQVQNLATQRTDRGVAAATWLEAYGKKDVWKLAVHDQAELLPAGAGERRKQQVDDLLAMSKDVADALGATFQQPAPYVVDPHLRPDHTVVPGQRCPCSYPSRHATAAAAARTFLAALVPRRADDYRWTEEEIAYSRVYMAGHVPSDITAGALLGDMIGEYFLLTRAHRSVTADSAGT